MTVSHEIKSQLAKLLATEDLIVEHKHVETACFNVHTRVLTLPMWEKASNAIYDLLVSHEVGHALFTPDEDWLEKVAIPMQFVNVVEDARIEKLMKRKYAGIGKTFYNGYRGLNDEDFFDIDGKCVADFNLADRANLYFKIGNYVNIPFHTSEESLILEKISNAETFDDVLKVAEELYLFCKKEKEEKDDNMPIPPEVQNQMSESQNPSQSQKTQEGRGDNPSGDSGGASSDGGSTTGNSSPGDSGDPEVHTADALEGNLEDLVDSDSCENLYVEIPKVNLENVIASNSEVHSEIDYWFNLQQETSETNLFTKPDGDYVKFKRNAQKEVNYLVKEFECRKAADSYARSNVARTGILDTAKLHTYKYNEDLFKKVSVIPDGKNHGLIFILDWSGSMSRVMNDTIKQLYNLIWFCKKVSIPFDVYAFSNEWKGKNWDVKNQNFDLQFPSMYQKKENLLSVNDDFALMNLFTSSVNGKQLEHQMRNVWRIAQSFNDFYCSAYSIPNRLSLSGTPLNEAIVCLHQILPEFQKKYKLQKVQCIVLSDGEANHLPYHVEVKRHWDIEPYMGTRQLHGGVSFLRDRKTGNTYKVPYEYYAFTDMMLQNIRDNFPSVNFVGIRVLESRDASTFMKRYYDMYTDAYDKVYRDWKKLRSFTIKTSGYDAYFAVSSNSLSQNSDFEVDDGATKAKIKSAFVKSLKTKKLNKKVLGEFISLVV